MTISKTRSIFGIIFMSLLIAGALFLNGNGEEVNADTKEVYKNIEIFAEVLRKIEKSYVEPKDPHELIYGAIQGMVGKLDPHSSFMPKDDYKELLMETEGSFTGIGIEITLKDNILTVVSPIEGTPAFKAGIKAGDRIIRVEDKSTKGMTLLQAVKLIRGPKGTIVKLTIVRKGEKKPLELPITRDEIPLVSVRNFHLTPDISYIRVTSFQKRTVKDLKSALEDVEKDGSLKGLILDLRNNPGGLLAQAIEVSDIFLDSGVIVSTKGRDSRQNITATANKNSKLRVYPIIVLINGGSASASEIVAGALQDNKRAIILGTRSFGKGSVQTILPLSDGSGLRLTTARYYTPSGKSIQSLGIVPDIEVEYVPPPEKAEKDQPHFVREEDLEGHMLGEKEETVDEDKNDEEPDGDQRAKTLLERDNQVRNALQLLKTWTVFSEINTGS